MYSLSDSQKIYNNCKQDSHAYSPNSSKSTDSSSINHRDGEDIYLRVEADVSYEAIRLWRNKFESKQAPTFRRRH